VGQSGWQPSEHLCVSALVSGNCGCCSMHLGLFIPHPHACRDTLCCAVQPLYKKLLGFEVFGLGFMTSVVSDSCKRQGRDPGVRGAGLANHERDGQQHHTETPCMLTRSVINVHSLYPSGISITLVIITLCCAGLCCAIVPCCVAVVHHHHWSVFQQLVGEVRPAAIQQQ